MISLVSGTVVVRRPDHVVLDTSGGVGYRLSVSAETLRTVPAIGGSAVLHTHLVLRDDGLMLYGFAAEEERDLFLLLVGVQNVGPKVALAVLGLAPPRELAAAIAGGDAGRLQAAPGVGKRVAERIVSELRDKAGGFGGEDDPARPGEIVVTRGDDPRRMAREGLVELGWNAVEAEALLRDADGETPEALIAQALRAARR